MEQQVATEVVALVTDLFFSVSLGNQIKRAGYVPRIVKTTVEFRDALSGPHVALGIVDLSSRADLDELRSNGQRQQNSDVPIIAFGPHKNVDAFREAKAAGLTRVMSNSQFHAQTIEMIQRYARSETAESER